MQKIWNSDNLESRILGDSGEYPVLRRTMDGLLEQYGIGLGMAVKYVGGSYQYRDHRGQPGRRDAVQPVAAVKQREALDFLAERAFAVDAFSVSPKLLDRLAPDRWQHWGVADNFGIYTGPRLDYNLQGDWFLTCRAPCCWAYCSRRCSRACEKPSRARPTRSACRSCSIV